MKIRYFGIYKADDSLYAYLLIVKFESVSRKSTHILSSLTGKSTVEEHPFEKTDYAVLEEILFRAEYSDCKIVEIDAPGK